MATRRDRSPCGQRRCKSLSTIRHFDRRSPPRCSGCPIGVPSCSSRALPLSRWPAKRRPIAARGAGARSNLSQAPPSRSLLRPKPSLLAPNPLELLHWLTRGTIRAVGVNLAWGLRLCGHARSLVVSALERSRPGLEGLSITTIYEPGAVQSFAALKERCHVH